MRATRSREACIGSYNRAGAPFVAATFLYSDGRFRSRAALRTCARLGRAFRATTVREWLNSLFHNRHLGPNDAQAVDQLKVADVGRSHAIAEFQGAGPDRQIRKRNSDSPLALAMGTVSG